MGARIIAKGVNAEDYVSEYSALVTRGLEAIHFTNVNLAKAARNYAPGKAQGAAIGAPVPSADRIACVGQSDFIQTGIQEPSQMTFLLAARSADANTSASTRPGFIGTYDGVAADGGAADGFAMFFSGNGQVAVNAGYGTTAADKVFPRANLSAANAATWALYSVVISSAGITFKDLTNNRSVTQSATSGLPRRPSTNKIRLGSLFRDYTGKCDLAAMMLYSVVLTDDEQAQVAADMRGYLARKGITV